MLLLVVVHRRRRGVEVEGDRDQHLALVLLKVIDDVVPPLSCQ